VKRLVLLGLAGAGAFLIARAGRDPRGWPDAAREELERLKAHLREAIEAGKRAAARREAEVQREIDEAVERR
jgi:hypothetical protein